MNLLNVSTILSQIALTFITTRAVSIKIAVGRVNGPRATIRKWPSLDTKSTPMKMHFI